MAIRDEYTKSGMAYSSMEKSFAESPFMRENSKRLRKLGSELHKDQVGAAESATKPKPEVANPGDRYKEMAKAGNPDGDPFENITTEMGSPKKRDTSRAARQTLKYWQRGSGGWPWNKDRDV